LKEKRNKVEQKGKKRRKEKRREERGCFKKPSPGEREDKGRREGGVNGDCE
jgi:hypothetical protein